MLHCGSILCSTLVRLKAASPILTWIPRRFLQDFPFNNPPPGSFDKLENVRRDLCRLLLSSRAIFYRTIRGLIVPLNKWLLMIYARRKGILAFSLSSFDFHPLIHHGVALINYAYGLFKYTRISQFRFLQVMLTTIIIVYVLFISLEILSDYIRMFNYY
jgi:hypothetical protein